MRERNRLLSVIGRLLVAAVVGLVVAGTAYLCTYFDQRSWPQYRTREESTQRKLDSLHLEIERHRRTTGRLPADLADLEGVHRYRHFAIDAAGRVVDLWDRPYHYRVEGDAFVLFSLGADGQEGGFGRDADLYPTTVGRPPELPTLRQFTLDLPTKALQRTCIAAGIGAALVCVLVTRSRRGTNYVGRVAATMVGFFLAAIAITSLQIPPPH
jgi:hypothetical protein